MRGVWNMLMGEGPVLKARVQTLQEQDAIFEMYDHYGIVNGVPGRLCDAEVREHMALTLRSNLSRDEKYFILDTLTFDVQNNHAAGMAAGVLNEISAEISKLILGGA